MNIKESIEAAHQGIAELRRQIREKKAERAAVEEQRTITLAEVNQRIDAMVDRLAAEYGLEARLRESIMRHEPAPDVFEELDLLETTKSMSVRKSSMLPALAALDPDWLKAKLKEAAKRAHSTTDAMSQETRRKKLAEIDAEILRLETEEERAITEAEANGLNIMRRAEADPRAVLEELEP